MTNMYSKKQMSIAVFVSGNGTTLQSIIDNIANNNLDAKICLVVSNNENSFALKRAEQANINTYIIKHTNTEEVEIELLNVLKDYDIDLIVLAGYLKLVGQLIISNYQVINIHPSLLPKFGGLGMYGLNVHKAIIEAKEEYSGATIHFVNAFYDEGNVIKQKKIKIMPEDDAISLAQKVQTIEKELLLEVLEEFVDNINYKNKLLNLSRR